MEELKEKKADKDHVEMEIVSDDLMSLDVNVLCRAM